MTTELMIPEQVKTGDGLVEQAQAMMILTAPQYEAACAMLLTAKAGSRACDEAFDEDIANWNHGHKNALATKKRYQDPFLKIEVILKPRIRSYQDEQEHQRQVAQKKAQEEAQLAEAIHHEQLGDNHSAEQVLDGRGVVSVSVPTSLPKVAGISPRDYWSALVEDKLALIKAVASGLVPLEAVDPNQALLNEQARALKPSTSQDIAQFSVRYPGVKAICEKSVAGRR